MRCLVAHGGGFTIPTLALGAASCGESETRWVGVRSSVRGLSVFVAVEALVAALDEDRSSASDTSAIPSTRTTTPAPRPPASHIHHAMAVEGAGGGWLAVRPSAYEPE